MAPESVVRSITLLAFILHIGGGAIGLASGTVAAFARKGGALHRRAGTIFVVSMLVMSVLAIYLAVAEPDQLTNVFIGAFAIYLVSTGWASVRRRTDPKGPFEKIALVVALCLCAPFVTLSCQLAMGFTPLFKSAVPFQGPVLIAIYSFTSILVLAAIGDARVVFGGALSAVSRISRHLWRMCLGLTLAAGSGFTNGFARLLPGPYHVPNGFFLPQFLPLGLLLFWIIRVRSKGWRQSVVEGDSGPNHLPGAIEIRHS
jgi:hypothetical protein